MGVKVLFCLTETDKKTNYSSSVIGSLLGVDSDFTFSGGGGSAAGFAFFFLDDFLEDFGW